MSTLERMISTGFLGGALGLLAGLAVATLTGMFGLILGYEFAVATGVIGLALGLAIGAATPDFRWAAGLGRILTTAFKWGGVALFLGFVGPLLVLPEPGLGPLLGIFFTGPLGFLLGLILGTRREMRRPPD